MYLATEASISSSAKVLQDHECFLNNCLQASSTKNEKKIQKVNSFTNSKI